MEADVNSGENALGDLFRGVLDGATGLLALDFERDLAKGELRVAAATAEAQRQEAIANQVLARQAQSTGFDLEQLMPVFISFGVLIVGVGVFSVLRP